MGLLTVSSTTKIASVRYTMSRQFERLQNFVNSLQDDFEKFYVKENKAAGTRIRKSMQELKSIAQEIRVEIQEKKNAS